MCTPAPIEGPHGWLIRHMWWRPLGFSTLGARLSAFHECLIKAEGAANDEKCHKRRHKMSREDRFESLAKLRKQSGQSRRSAGGIWQSAVCEIWPRAQHVYIRGPGEGRGEMAVNRGEAM